MSSAAVGSGPLSLMSCVRESSPPIFDSENEKCAAATSKRRFWNPKKWFRRKAKVTEDATVDAKDAAEIVKDSLRSRSASELSVADEDRRNSSSMHPGLSVSHDSVFHSPNSGSDMELDAAQSRSSLSISQPIVDLRLQTELSERLKIRRSRGDTSEDDEGLPRSPCNSPTVSDGLREKNAIKDHPTKSHSTCSDGSLLSMGSYEDEDSFGPQSRHSSKLSLHEKKTISDSSFEFEPSSGTVPLNHSAAHHRVSVKPKRTHGPPRRKRGQQLSMALPATPEVNEDSSVRSLSPDPPKKDTLTELYSLPAVTDPRIKCSSLPPGLSAPGADAGKLNRSKSNAGSKSRDSLAPSTDHDDDDKQEKVSLFDRIFPRRSGRKKREASVTDSGPAGRQRVAPQDLGEAPQDLGEGGEDLGEVPPPVPSSCPPTVIELGFSVGSIPEEVKVPQVEEPMEEPLHSSEVTLELKTPSLITITGPSHTPMEVVASATTKSIETAVVEGSRTISINEHQVSVTKIHVEHPLDVEPMEAPLARKFSKENLEIVETVSVVSRSPSLDSLEKHAVVLRRKSANVKGRVEEPPELMKVFARRSLKLKDGELEALQDSLEQRASPVVLRRTFNSNIFIGHRAVSCQVVGSGERRRADTWMTSLEDEGDEEEEGGVLKGKSEFITEPKNFSQRKAEWEKRAQQAQKKAAY